MRLQSTARRSAPSSRRSPGEIWRTVKPAFWKHGSTLLLGLAGGVLCFLLAELSTPSAPPSAAEHDRLITQRLGLILGPALALGLGWLQRSWQRALIGVGCGLLAGWLCYTLCSGAFQPILLALPILLGTLSTVFCASHHDDWLRCLASRFGKGLLVGLVLGTVYIALLGLGEPLFWPRSGNADYTGAYLRMMRLAGPFALGVSCAILLPAMRWATGLEHSRAILSGTGARGPLSEAVRRFKAAAAHAS